MKLTHEQNVEIHKRSEEIFGIRSTWFIHELRRGALIKVEYKSDAAAFTVIVEGQIDRHWTARYYD